MTRQAMIVGSLSVLLWTAGMPLVRADDDSKQAAARRLDKMKRAAADYSLSYGDEKKESLQLVAEPVFRWTNPVNASKDGTLFVWTHADRPEAVVGFYTFDDAQLSHEWQSLSSRPMTAEYSGESVWRPEAAGVTFQPVPKAERPASTAAVRLRQMKTLAAGFSSTFTPSAGPENQPAVDLRLLPQPLHRYGNAESSLIDGALFGYVQGTDPQVLLLLEARRMESGQEWFYAPARMASGAVTMKRGDQIVWTEPRYDFKPNPKRPYVLLFKPIPSATANPDSRGIEKPK